MKKFNVTGICVPAKHYMVDIGEKLRQIMELIDDCCYFTINRARQYGKTTTLSMIQKTLPSGFICVRISFQGIEEKFFETSEAFCKLFIELVYDSLKFTSVNDEYRDKWLDTAVIDIYMLKRHISRMCEDKKVVLLIDEVDHISSYRVFRHFLNMLREKFLLRAEDMDETFHSVILAGVYDIKNIKLKLIEDGKYTLTATENKIISSPWNIAVDFMVDMSFNPAEITTMLAEYEADHNTGMDIAAIAEEIYSYTSGYPFMVSRICQHIDEKLDKDWTVGGVRKAVRMMLDGKNMLFDDVFKNIENNKELSKYIYDLLVMGESKPYNIYDPVVNTGDRYGFFKKQGNGSGSVAISNKIFELIMIEYFITKDLRDKKQITGIIRSDVIKDGSFDMELCLRKFAEHYGEIFNENDAEFLERHGWLLFISYLQPLINGLGFYHIESQFTDLRRMDIIVDFGRQQFIIELRIWRGKQYEQNAYEQLLGYMDNKKALTGYILTFDFRKGSNKKPKAEWAEIDGKRIFTVVV